jgi:hypothetical protein
VRKLIQIVLLCILAISCGKEESADTFATGASSSSTGWTSSRFPLQLKVSSAFSSAQATAISDMNDQWYQAVENKVDFFASVDATTNLEYTNTDDYNDGVMGIYQLNTWPAELSSSALAVTQLYGIKSGSNITLTHADILVNEENYDFTTDPTDYDKYDFHTVMLHEIGHFLGLGHQSYSVESVMQPSVSKIDANRETTNADKGNISVNYGVDSSYNSFATLESESTTSVTAGLSSSLDTLEDGQVVKMLLQLLPSGECIHTIEGKVFHKH